MVMPVRLLLVGFVAACLMSGGGVLYLDTSNDPMSYRDGTGGFDYEYALVTALIAGASLGPFVFSIGLLVFGIGYVLVLGAQLVLRRSR
jgi:hypothetical protein